MNSGLANFKKKEKPKPSKYQRIELEPSPYRGESKPLQYLNNITNNKEKT